MNLKFWVKSEVLKAMELPVEVYVVKVFKISVESVI